MRFQTLKNRPYFACEHGGLLQRQSHISGKARVLVLKLICYTSGTIKMCPSLKSTAQLAYIVTMILGGIFNVFITFSNVSMMYPIK